MSCSLSTSILSLPMDVIRIICTYLPPKPCLALMLSCRRFMVSLSRDLLVWRKIMQQLNIPFQDKDIECNNKDEKFPSLFLRFIEIRRNLKNNLSNGLHKSSRLYYNIEFESQGRIESTEGVDTKKKSKARYKTIANLITHSTLAYDFDESYFVLIQSKDRSAFWHSYRPQTTNSSVPIHSRVNVYNIKGGTCEYVGSSDLPFEVAGQDLKVYRGLLFLLPIRDPNTEHIDNEILLIYKIMEGAMENILQLMTSFSLEPTIECPDRCRLPPQVYKESGEKRIYILDRENRELNANLIDILIVVPCPVWTISILKLSIVDSHLSLVKEVQIKEASLAAMGQVFAADQKSTTIALALYTSMSASNKRFKSLIAIIDIPPQPKPQPTNYRELKERHTITPIIEVLNGGDRPNFVNHGFNLFGHVQDMKLYYVSATNYYHTQGGICLVHAKARKSRHNYGYYAPVLVFLLASDKIILYSTHNTDGQCLNLHSLFGISNRCLAKNWHYSELQVLDKVSFKKQ